MLFSYIPLNIKRRNKLEIFLPNVLDECRLYLGSYLYKIQIGSSENNSHSKRNKRKAEITMNNLVFTSFLSRRKDPER